VPTAWIRLHLRPPRNRAAASPCMHAQPDPAGRFFDSSEVTELLKPRLADTASRSFAWFAMHSQETQEAIRALNRVSHGLRTKYIEVLVAHREAMRAHRGTTTVRTRSKTSYGRRASKYTTNSIAGVALTAEGERSPHKGEHQHQHQKSRIPRRTLVISRFLSRTGNGGTSTCHGSDSIK
jgi:hypothetical protein